MRALFLIFSLLFAVDSSYAQSVFKQEEFLLAHAFMSILVGSDFHREFFSGEYADERTQEMVKEIMHDMGFADSACIHVMYLNNQGFKLWGVENLIATSNTIFIDHEWFDQLSLEEQQFILAHEVAHIYAQDTRIASVVTATSCALLIYTLYRYCYDKESAATYFGLFGFCSLVLPAFGRYLEERADINGAKVLGTAEGGIKCCKRWLRERYIVDTEYSRLEQFYYDMVATHPSSERRLETLEALRITL